jgi:hypothetical protein
VDSEEVAYEGGVTLDYAADAAHSPHTVIATDHPDLIYGNRRMLWDAQVFTAGHSYEVEWAQGAFTDLSGNPLAAGRIAFTLDAFQSGVVDMRGTLDDALAPLTLRRPALDYVVRIAHQQASACATPLGIPSGCDALAAPPPAHPDQVHGVESYDNILIYFPEQLQLGAGHVYLNSTEDTSPSPADIMVPITNVGLTREGRVLNITLRGLPLVKGHTYVVSLHNYQPFRTGALAEEGGIPAHPYFTDMSEATPGFGTSKKYLAAASLAQLDLSESYAIRDDPYALLLDQEPWFVQHYQQLTELERTAARYAIMDEVQGTYAFTMQPAAVPRRRRIPPKFPDESISNPELFFPANKNIKMPAGAMLSLKLNITGWFIPCVQGLSMGYACSRVYLDEYPRKETTFNCVDELNPQLGTSKAACCETGASARLRRLKIDLSGAVQARHFVYLDPATSTLYYRHFKGLRDGNCYVLDIQAGLMGSEMLDAMKGYGHQELWFATTRVPAVDTFPPEIDPDANPFPEGSLVAPGVKLTSGVLDHASVSTAVVIHFTEKVSTNISRASATLVPTGNATILPRDYALGNAFTVTVVMDELEPGVEYTLTVDGVEDLAGNVQLWPTVLTFKAAVADDVAPMVLYQSPSTGELTSTATTVMLRLSEALDPEAGEIRMGPTDYDRFVLKDLHIPYYDNQTGARELKPKEKDPVAYLSLEGNRLVAQAKYPLDATERYHFQAIGLADLGGNLITPLPNLTFSPQAPNVTQLAALFRRKGAAMASVREGGFFLGGVLVGGLGLDDTPAEEVCTLRDGEVQWSECTAAPGLGKRMGASTAADANGHVWVVGGTADSFLARSAWYDKEDWDGTSPFVRWTATPLPFQDVQADGSVRTLPGELLPEELPGSAVAVIKGWQVLMCGGGLTRCWRVVDGSGELWARTDPVPYRVSHRWQGTLLSSAEGLYFAGGHDNGGFIKKWWPCVWFSTDGDGWTLLTADAGASAAPSPFTLFESHQSAAVASDGTLFLLGVAEGETTVGMYAMRPGRRTTPGRRPARAARAPTTGRSTPCASATRSRCSWPTPRRRTTCRSTR